MGNELATVDQNSISATRWLPPALPERLAGLVKRAKPFGPDVPALSDEEAAIAERALVAYRQYPSFSTARQVNKMMTKLALGYPNQKISTVEADARMELYAEQLGDLPLDVLGAGFVAAVRALKFFPSVSELRELALKQPAPARMVEQQRLAVLLHAHRHREPAIEQIVDPEDFNRDMERFGSRMRMRPDATTYLIQIGDVEPDRRAEAA